MMNTKTLMVGQDVYMESGVYSCEGKVVKVTPSGVEVLIPRRLPLEREELLHFDNEGKGRNSEGTYECGPWCIDEMPFTERMALIEEAAQRFQKWNSIDCEHSKDKFGTHYYIEKCPICECDNPNYNPKDPKRGYHFRLRY